MGKKFVAVLVPFVTVIVASCGDSGEATESGLPSPSAPKSSSLVASFPPAPQQSESDHPIEFDPCVEIGDDLIEKSGFDPKSRERSSAEMVSPLITAIGCDFKRTAVSDGNKVITGGLSIKSTNSTLAELHNSDSREIFDTTPIGDRAAAFYRTPKIPGRCSAEVETPDGVLAIDLTVFPGPIQVPPPCDQIRDLAPLFAQALDQ